MNIMQNCNVLITSCASQGFSSKHINLTLDGLALTSQLKST